MKRQDEAEGTPSRISVRQLTKTYRRGDELVHALAGIDITIAAGTFVAVMGQSGSGKTTLLNVLTGVDRPTAGEIWLDQQRIDIMSEAQLAVLRRKRIGLVFQSFQLLANMTALENVLLPALLIGISANEARKRASRLLDELGLASHMRKLPSQLSGGQQQRVAIGRALVNEPAVLFADEPTGNLDAKTGQEVLNLFKGLHTQGQTIVLITHDVQVASQAQRIITMRDGRILDDMESQRGAAMAVGLLADVSGLSED